MWPVNNQLAAVYPPHIVMPFPECVTFKGDIFLLSCYVHTIHSQESSVECYKYNSLDKAVSHKSPHAIPYHSLKDT